MLAAERGSLNSSFGVQVAAHRGCNEQHQSSQTGTSLPQHLLPQLRPQNGGSCTQKRLIRTNGSRGGEDRGVCTSTGFRMGVCSSRTSHIPPASRAGIEAAAEAPGGGRGGGCQGGGGHNN